MSSKLDLGRGYVYTFNSALIGSEDAGKSLNARLTTPHADWQTLEAPLSHGGQVNDFKSSAYLSTPLMDAVSALLPVSATTRLSTSPPPPLSTRPATYVKDWKMEVRLS